MIISYLDQSSGLLSSLSASSPLKSLLYMAARVSSWTPKPDPIPLLPESRPWLPAPWNSSQLLWRPSWAGLLVLCWPPITPPLLLSIQPHWPSFSTKTATRAPPSGSLHFASLYWECSPPRYLRGSLCPTLLLGLCSNVTFSVRLGYTPGTESWHSRCLPCKIISHVCGSSSNSKQLSSHEWLRDPWGTHHSDLLTVYPLIHICKLHEGKGLGLHFFFYLLYTVCID